MLTSIKKFADRILPWVTGLIFIVFWVLVVIDLDAHGIHLSTVTKAFGVPVFAWIGCCLGRLWKQQKKEVELCRWRKLLNEEVLKKGQ